MKEKLIIKNFGPIKDVELELGKFNVLIGEQATGKSTVAKVLAVSRYFSYLVPSNERGLEWEGSNFLEGLDSWGLMESIKEDTFISYKCKHYFIEISSNYNEIEIHGQQTKFITASIKLNPLSSEFKNLLKELDEIKPKHIKHNYNWTIPTSFYQNDVSKVLDNPFYLPTERGLQSIFSLGKNSIQNISDSLFNQLAELDQIARSFKEETLIEPMDITYKNVDGRGYIKSKRHGFLSLFNAATGYQNIIPIVLLIKYYTDQKFKKKKKTFIIEEPGENLFPTAQFELVKFLVENLKYHNAILLTTHTPYILTSLNNLIYAYQVGQNHKEDVNKIIEEEYWINPEHVSAYQLLPDGTCENIIDETGLIMAEKIDVISRQINSEFDAMQDIKLGIETTND